MTQTVAAEPIQPPQKVPIVPSAKPAAVPQAQTMTAVETPTESIISTSVPVVIDTQTSLPVEPEQVAAPELIDAPAIPAVETYRPPTPHVEGWVNRDPAYPYLARKRSLQGTVELLIQIDEQGLPAQITIASSSGYRLLDKAAEKAVWKWRFTPARQGDQAVAGELLVPIRFALEA